MTEADAVNARDQRYRQQLHEAQEFDAIQPPVLACLIRSTCRSEINACLRLR
jgi:hypothetical protein